MLDSVDKVHLDTYMFAFNATAVKHKEWWDLGLFWKNKMSPFNRVPTSRFFRYTETEGTVLGD